MTNFSKNAKIENGKSVVTFTDVPKGEYAVICFHDKNDNDKMDFDSNITNSYYVSKDIYDSHPFNIAELEKLTKN